MPYYVVYIIIPLLIYTFLIWTKKYKERKYQSIPFLYIAFIAMLGYDNVFDYAMYMRIFSNVRTYGFPQVIIMGDSQIESGYYFLNNLFAFTEYGLCFVAMISIGLFYHSVYIFFRKNKIVFVGSFVMLIMNCYQWHDNMLRNNITFAICNYLAYMWLYSSKTMKLKIILTVLWVFCGYYMHHSIIFNFIMLPLVILFTRIRKNVYLLFAIMMLIIILSRRIDMSSLLLANIYLLGDYGMKYDDIIKDWMASGMATGQISYFAIIKPLFILWTYQMMKKNKDVNEYEMKCVNYCFTIEFFSMCFVMVPFFQRTLFYFEIMQYMGYSFIILYYLRRKLKLVVSLYVAYSLFFYTRAIINYYWIYDYKSIFSNECIHHKQYIRPSLNINDKSIWNRRGKSVYVKM